MIDSHCHLNCLELQENETLDSAIQAAVDAGVKKMLCVAIDWEKLDEVLQIAKTHENVYASVGVHPTATAGYQPRTEDIIQKIKQSKKVIAVGETGLDYFREPVDKNAQQDKFIHHLEAAKKLALPTIVHTRAAKEDTLSIIQQHACPDSTGVLHCFTEDYDMAKRALDSNFYISFSGIVSFKNATNVHEVAKKLPLSKILIETDSPYLAPVPYRGKSNEPKYLPHVAKAIAELRGETEEKIIEETSKNFYRLFNQAI